MALYSDAAVAAAHAFSSALTAASGALAGTISPPALNPCAGKPSSFMVGTSGNDGMRVSVSAARIGRLLALATGAVSILSDGFHSLTDSASNVVALVGVRAVRAGSLADACFGQVVWQVTALAMVRGFVSKQQNPLQPIESNVLAAPEGH